VGRVGSCPENWTSVQLCILYLHRVPEQHQNLIGCYKWHIPRVRKISKFVDNPLSYRVHRQAHEGKITSTTEVIIIIIVNFYSLYESMESGTKPVNEKATVCIVAHRVLAGASPLPNSSACWLMRLATLIPTSKQHPRDRCDVRHASDVAAARFDSVFHRATHLKHGKARTVRV